jgi:hypothetical protein
LLIGPFLRQRFGVFGARGGRALAQAAINRFGDSRLDVGIARRSA